jgi:hypothetical protein
LSTIVPLRAALFSRLNGDPRLAGRVFDGEADQGQAGDFLVVGAGTSRPENTLDRRGRSDTLTLHGWSDARSAIPVAGLMETAAELLDGVALVVPGWRVVRVEREFSEMLLDTSGGEPWRHAVDRYRFDLQQVE